LRVLLAAWRQPLYKTPKSIELVQHQLLEDSTTQKQKRKMEETRRRQDILLQHLPVWIFMSVKGLSQYN
jgi:hypothetical protein